MGKPEDFVIVETGAETESLCRHILYAAKACPDFYNSLHYVMLNLNDIEICDNKISQCIYKDFSYH